MRHGPTLLSRLELVAARLTAGVIVAAAMGTAGCQFSVDGVPLDDGNDAAAPAEDLRRERDFRMSVVDSGRGDGMVVGCTGSGDCQPASACCGRRCVDPSSDPANCGTCGHACSGTQACCAGTCIDVSSDGQNCGACGATCSLAHAATTACMGGQCAVSTCASGFGDCNQMAADGCETSLLTDEKNCGACAAACALPHTSQTCVAGACAVGTCAAGFADCDKRPANGCEAMLAGDPMNCGACGTVCPGGAGGTCSVGKCGLACTGTKRDCDMNASNGCETDVAKDPLNCGMCGAACVLPHAVAGCASGVCTVASCTSGFRDCNGVATDGCEVDVTATPSMCGSCTNACMLPHASAGCAAGKCTIGTCDAGFADCNSDPSDGCEVDLGKPDNKNCGKCGLACGGGTACGTTVAQDFNATSQVGGWTYNGSARQSPGFRVGILTDAGSRNAAGSIVYNHAILTDSFTARFDFFIGLGGGADGMGFMLEVDGANKVGGTGGELGMGTLHGYGIELDTHDNLSCGDTGPNASNHVGVAQLSTCGGNLDEISPNYDPGFGLSDAQWHTLELSFQSGTVIVKIDGNTVIASYKIASYTPGTAYYYGFGGATGGTDDSHAIRNVTFNFPTPRCL